MLRFSFIQHVNWSYWIEQVQFSIHKYGICLLFALFVVCDSNGFFFGGGCIGVDASLCQKKTKGTWDICWHCVWKMLLIGSAHCQSSHFLKQRSWCVRKDLIFWSFTFVQVSFFGKEFVFMGKFFVFWRLTWIFLVFLLGKKYFLSFCNVSIWFFVTFSHIPVGVSSNFLKSWIQHYFRGILRSICSNLHRSFHFFQKISIIFLEQFKINFPQPSIIFPFSQFRSDIFSLNPVCNWIIFTLICVT